MEKYKPLTKEWWNDVVRRELLNEGGAYGHMAHPFDDKDLPFGDLKKIIELGLSGKLNREDNVTEKLDDVKIILKKFFYIKKNDDVKSLQKKTQELE